MSIFLAGASGVIGQRLIPRLVQAGHVVGGLNSFAQQNGVTEIVLRPLTRLPGGPA